MSEIIVTNLCSIINPGAKCVDGTLITISAGTGIFGIINIVLLDTLTGFGFLTASTLGLISLYAIKKMRLRASVQKSVNVLKQENDELKENNEDLKENNEILEKNVDELEENIDSLENTIINLKNVEINLKDDLDKLKTLLGLVGTESKDIIKEIKDILNKIKTENNRHGDLIKQQVLTYLCTINEQNENDNDIIIKFKNILTEFYPNLEWESIVTKIKNKELL